MAKRRRYIKRNAIDYILIAVAVLLLLSLVLRGVGVYLDEHEDRRCTATVSFTVRAVDWETALVLQMNAKPAFRFLDTGMSLDNVSYTGIQKTVDIVEGENGEFEEVSLSGRYDISFTAHNVAGIRAKDGGFLLGGSRRLATGDTAELVADDAKYAVKFSLVRIS